MDLNVLKIIMDFLNQNQNAKKNVSEIYKNVMKMNLNVRINIIHV